MDQQPMEEQQFGEINHVHAETFELEYDEKRSFKKFRLLSKCSFLLYHITSILVSFSRIETNHLFVSYCIALVGMLISTSNMMRYEYAHYKIYGRIFSSLEEFKLWRSKQFPVLNYVFGGLEIMLQIYFLIDSWPLKFDTFAAYELSIGLLQIQIILLIMLGALLALFSCCMVLCSGSAIQIISSSGSQQGRLPPSPPPPPPNSLTTTIISGEHFIDLERECCICLDKNTKQWVTTRCTHAFHQECIANWTQNSTSCPVCRSNLF